MKTNITLYLLTAFIVVIAVGFIYGIYRREQEKQRDSKIRLAARDQALLIEQKNKHHE